MTHEAKLHLPSDGRQHDVESSAQPAHKPVRIVHFITEPCGPDSANGVVKAAYYLARAQRQLGNETLIAADITDTPRRLSVGARLLATVAAPIRRIAELPPRHLVEGIRAFQPDLVHFHSIHVPENIWFASQLRRKGIPYCVTVHGGLSPHARRRHRLRKVALGWIGERRYLNAAAFVHALTPLEADHIRTYGTRAPIVELPNGIAVDALQSPADPAALFKAAPHLRGRRIFMFTGRLDPVLKGLDLLVQGFADAREREAALVFVGPDSNMGRARIEQMSRQLHIESGVVFLGPMFGQRLADVMAAADVFVHPSRSEGISLAVLEAAARGKPCLLTAAADPGGALGKAGAAIVADTTRGGIARAIRSLAAMDASALAAMGRRGRVAVAQGFDWRVIAQQMVTAYRRDAGA